MWKALFLMMMMLPSAVLADCVVLLHGLARTEGSLALMEDTLRRRGYEVVNRGYPSTRETLPDPDRGRGRTGGGDVWRHAGAFRDALDGRHPRPRLA